MKRILFVFLMLLSLGVSARPRDVMFDTDWWTDVDDACAIRILLWAEDQGLINLKGVCLSSVRPTSVPSIASYIDNEGRHSYALAADKAATDYAGRPSYHNTIIEAHPAREYETVDDIEDCVSYYRRILSSSRRKVDIISVGFMNCLAGLLESGPDEYSRLTGRELVRKKVRHLWSMAGKYPEGREYNFHKQKRSIEAGYKICTEWPTKITFLGFEVGVNVLSGGVLPEEDLLKKVLNVHGSGKGRSSWDPLTAYMCCLGSAEKAGFDTVRGTVTVSRKDGSNGFEVNPKGRHEYVVMKHDLQWYSDRLNEILLARSRKNN